MRNLLYIAFLLAVITAYLATPAHASSYTTQTHEDGSYGSSSTTQRYAVIYNLQGTQHIDVLSSARAAKLDAKSVADIGGSSMWMQATSSLEKKAKSQGDAYSVSFSGDGASCTDLIAGKDAALWWSGVPDYGMSKHSVALFSKGSGNLGCS